MIPADSDRCRGRRPVISIKLEQVFVVLEQIVPNNLSVDHTLP